MSIDVVNYWDFVRKDIKKETNFSNFKNWDLVRDIPIYSNVELVPEYIKECEKLIHDSEYRTLWSKHLKEPRLGHTDVSYKQAIIKFNNKETTGWVLKSLHHVLTFERMMQKSILDYDRIIEFGAGIGETARLILDAGFKGKYIIIDLPEILNISKYYLGNSAIYLDNIDEIQYIKKTLFIATWSVSECSLSYRNKISQKIRGYDQLIAFQNKFQDIENLKYFVEEWPYLTNVFYRLQNQYFHKADHGNMYLIGKGVNDTI